MRTRVIRVDPEVAKVIETQRQKLSIVERRRVSTSEAVRSLVIPIEHQKWMTR